MLSRHPRSRTWLACAFIAILSLAAALESASIARLLARQSPDPYGVEVALARFAVARARIPPGAPLGYMSDLQGEPATLAFL
ncbi:MAG: hypothetical protein NZ554_12515, partial [Bryobacteraceae bacterium]|nr:hypothetical protein [Bryobacteraceae bacterium]